MNNVANILALCTHAFMNSLRILDGSAGHVGHSTMLPCEGVRLPTNFCSYLLLIVIQFVIVEVC